MLIYRRPLQGGPGRIKKEGTFYVDAERDICLILLFIHISRLSTKADSLKGHSKQAQHNLLKNQKLNLTNRLLEIFIPIFKEISLEYFHN